VLQNTLKNIRAARDEDEGFTLIELMVVVLIIAILIAIAIPTFLGSRGKANDRAAQSSLRNAITAAKTTFTDTSSYLGVNAAALKAVEPSLNFVDATPSTAAKTVNVVSAATATDIIVEALSASGKCYYMTDSSLYGTGFAVAKADCTTQTGKPVAMTAAPSAAAVTQNAAATAPAWGNSW
jgi:type IV pilus assembly protein PilA